MLVDMNGNIPMRDCGCNNLSVWIIVGGGGCPTCASRRKLQAKYLDQVIPQSSMPCCMCSLCLCRSVICMRISM